MFVPHRRHPYGTPRPVNETTLLSLYVYDVLTSQEPHLCDSTARYRDRFTVLYVDYVLSSQETQPWDSTACYRDNFTVLYVNDVRTSHETRCGPPRNVTGIALLFICR
jgi:hypothetical protein